jgi:hypothetical protein
MVTASRQIAEEVDRDILDMLRRQGEALRPDLGSHVMGAMGRYGGLHPIPRTPNFGPPTPRPPELTVKKANPEPEPARRSRFARIDDD